MVVIKIEGPPVLCKTDEVGELCLCSGYAGVSYWGLQGITSTTFQVSNHDYRYKLGIMLIL